MPLFRSIPINTDRILINTNSIPISTNSITINVTGTPIYTGDLPTRTLPGSCRHCTGSQPNTAEFAMHSNMYTKISALSAFLVLIAGAGTAQAQLGIAAGLNFENLGDIQTSSAEGTFDNATGYHVGIFYDLGAVPIAVRPGIFIRDVGNVAFRYLGRNESVNLSFVEVPVDVRVPVIPAPLVKPYLLAGPVLSFPRSSDDEFDNGLEDIAVSATIGAGAQVTLPGVGLRLYPELRYAFGISGYLKDSFEVAGQSIEARDSATANTFMLRLGIGL